MISSLYKSTHDDNNDHDFDNDDDHDDDADRLQSMWNRLIIKISDFHKSIFRELQLRVGAQKVFIFSTHALNDSAGI